MPLSVFRTKIIAAGNLFLVKLATGQCVASKFSKVQDIALRGACLLMGGGHLKLAIG